MIVKNVIEKLEEFAPPKLAECDRPGLLEGYLNGKVKKIGITLDGTLNAVEKAVDEGVDFLIVHHGISGNAGFTTEAYFRKMSLIREHKIVVYRMHLNLDFCKYGIQWQLCKLLGMHNIETADFYYKGNYVHNGAYCAYGDYSFPALIRKIMEVMQIDDVCIYGNPDREKRYKKFAVASGSGFQVGFAEQLVKYHHPDIFISGEINILGLREAQEASLPLIATTHYSNEGTALKEVTKHLSEKVFPEIPMVFIEDPETRQLISKSSSSLDSQKQPSLHAPIRI